MTCFHVLEHPPERASISTGQVCVGSEHYGFATANREMSPKNGGRGQLSSLALRVSLNFRLDVDDHQGMIFLMPFFFLLVDSLLLFPLVPACVVSCTVAPSVLGASVV
jgi:hypothetical protein